MRNEVSVAVSALVLGGVSGWLGVALLAAIAGDTPSAVVAASPVQPNVPPPGFLFLGIVGRNMTVFGLLLTGVLTWGVTSLSTLVFNGLALGGLMASSLRGGMPTGTLAALLLPHGIIELGAFVTAGAIGLRGWSIGRQAMRTGRFDVDLVALRGPATIAGAAILVAAAIESTVTRHLLLAAVGTP